jgi:hypothetical protein
MDLTWLVNQPIQCCVVVVVVVVCYLCCVMFFLCSVHQIHKPRPTCSTSGGDLHSCCFYYTLLGVIGSCLHWHVGFDTLGDLVAFRQLLGRFTIGLYRQRCQ